MKPTLEKVERAPTRQEWESVKELDSQIKGMEARIIWLKGHLAHGLTTPTVYKSLEEAWAILDGLRLRRKGVKFIR